jgi:hypothetical protein
MFGSEIRLWETRRDRMVVGVSSSYEVTTYKLGVRRYTIM